MGTDANECVDGTSKCNVNAVCTNTLGSYTCACTSGYYGDGFTCTSGKYLHAFACYLYGLFIYAKSRTTPLS